MALVIATISRPLPRAMATPIALLKWPQCTVPLARPHNKWQTSALSFATIVLFASLSAIPPPLVSGVRLAKTLLITGFTLTWLVYDIACSLSTLNRAPATRATCLARLCNNWRNLVALGDILGHLVEKSLSRVRTSESGACNLRVVPLANRCRVANFLLRWLSTRPNDPINRSSLGGILLATPTLAKPPGRIPLI